MRSHASLKLLLRIASLADELEYSAMLDPGSQFGLTFKRIQRKQALAFNLNAIYKGEPDRDKTFWRQNNLTSNAELQLMLMSGYEKGLT